MKKEWHEFVDKENMYAVKKRGTRFSEERLEDIFDSIRDSYLLTVLNEDAIRVLRDFKGHAFSELVFKFNNDRGYIYIDYYDPFLERMNQIGIDDFYSAKLLGKSFIRVLPLQKFVQMLRLMDKPVAVYFLEDDDKLMYVASDNYIGMIACLLDEQEPEVEVVK